MIRLVIRSRPWRTIDAIFTGMILVVGSLANLNAAQSNNEDLSRSAIQLLREKCIACHGAKKSEGELRLDIESEFRNGGERGSLIDAKDPAKSLLLRSIAGQDPDLQMPPKNPLSPAQVKLIQSWLEAGAPWFDMQEDSQAAIGDAWTDVNNPIRQKFNGQRLELWSLRPIARPEVPKVINQAWPNNPIDSFVLAKWEADGRVPSARLDPRGLIRRLSMDLCGLPPDYSEVSSFIENPTSSSLDSYIDRLIGSPDYGRHFGRLWLDVVRYSDSNGFDWDEYRKEAWRYRDYVIDSWNRDLPYSDFVKQQLAGDELVEGTPSEPEEQRSLIATGYLRMGPQDNAAPLFNEQDRSRAELLADLTETTGSAFLGLTFSCCRCHDHKTDPLSHEDHYRFRAFFASVEYGDKLSLDLVERAKEIEAHNAPLEKEIEQIDKEIKQIPKENKAKRKELDDQKSTVRKKMLPYTRGLLMTDSEKEVGPTFLFEQGDHRLPQQQVLPGFPSVLFPKDASFDPPTNPKTRGRRLTLANWIVSDHNPWTARVLVNRLWQAHFGTGLVSTCNDFGLSGGKPTHPELLDWLAAELMENEWSIKHVQRLIVTSQVYQQQVTKGPSSVSLRSHLRRLSAEQLRDSLLSASGLLQRISGGTAVWPELPDEILQANPAFLDDNDTKTKGWYPSAKERQTARSIYLIQKRTVRLPWLESFDLPENSVSCPQRENSIVATQALTLLNGELTVEASIAMANRLKNLDSQRSQIVRGFEYAFLRPPTELETSASLDFLSRHSLESFCRALLNANEFLFYE